MSYKKFKIGISAIIILWLASAVSACGGMPVSALDMQNITITPGMSHGADTSKFKYDKFGNLIDENGNIAVDKSNIKITPEIAKRIAEKYIDENYKGGKIRNIVLMYEHGVIEYKVEVTLEQAISVPHVGTSNVFSINIDAATGNIYGPGCMGGPNVKGILKYYDPEEFVFPSVESNINETSQNSTASGINIRNTSLLIIEATFLGLILAASSISVYTLYSRLSKIEKTIKFRD